jgi:hypothetical protein
VFSGLPVCRRLIVAKLALKQKYLGGNIFLERNYATRILGLQAENPTLIR